MRVSHTVLLRLLGAVLLFSCVVTVFLTAFQVHRDYQRGAELVRDRIDQIDSSARHSLSEALWRLDRAQLQLELDGIRQLPDICAASVSELDNDATQMTVTSGQCASGALVTREYPLVHRIDDRDERQIGTLRVQATLSNLYGALRRTVFETLANQATHTFLVSLFAAWLCYLLVTRHLGTIARSVRHYDYHEPPRPLLLNRAASRRRDELDEVVSAFNAMGMRLYRAYLDEHATAVEREARQTAEAANRAKGEFLANMSHELRAPLNGILGYAQLLSGEASLDARQRGQVSAIRRSGEHLLSLIDDILDSAKLDAARLRLDIGDVPLADLLDAVGELISVKAEQKQIGFLCTVSADAPSGVRADAKRLRQVLLNLLDNAVKFSSEGTISLRVTRAEPDTVRFEVRDTGIGIPEDQLTTVFERFQQVHAAVSHDGTGLGLAISRQLVRAMGGDIGLESAVGLGSTFSFELPAASSVPARERTTEPQAVGGPDAARDDHDSYVVPEDEKDTIRLLARHGDMLGIQRWTERIAALDARYAPFAARLRELAASFQSKQIMRLVERQFGEREP